VIPRQQAVRPHDYKGRAKSEKWRKTAKNAAPSDNVAISGSPTIGKIPQLVILH
jgi:hypothetical protein